jgi:4-amino-4-deoxy-L-arabinose transferase-like glycosyltransferase
LAVNQWKAEGEIEPPVMERLSAWGYRLVGADDLRVPRFLSIFFWTLGGVGLFLVSQALIGAKGAVVGLAFYMVLPYMLYASRSFQPEPLMTAAIIWSWWAMVRWAKKRTWAAAITAGLISGLAIYIKLPAVFFVLPAFVGLMLTAGKLKKVLGDAQVIVIAVLSILPALIYHIDGFFISGFLQAQTSFRFFPELLTDPFHYLSWKDMIDSTLGIELFLIGLVGVWLIKEKSYRVMFVSLFVGYFLYGTVFDYHIVTHSYYQIPLTPIVAVGLAAWGGAFVERVKGRRLVALIFLGGVLFFWMAYNFWDARMTLKHADYREEAVYYAELGSELKDYSVVAIMPNYGYRLGYWGWKQTTNWKSVGDFVMREMAGLEIDREEMLLDAIEGQDLFLITDFVEFESQPEVKANLSDTFPIYDEGDGYLIFDLRDAD